VDQEISRLVAEGFLTEEQGSMVSREDIAAFFQSDLGQRLRCGAEHLREFKFSILDDASKYENPAEGEQVLLQGVVDCAIVEEDGITIIDFKTDKVTEETVDAVTEGYKLQVHTYGEALSRIYEKPIKIMKLWFFRLKRFVDV
jgi:ATP-dependent helicase/nuclease subunit A